MLEESVVTPEQMTRAALAFEPLPGSKTAAGLLEDLNIRYPRWIRIYDKIDECRVLSKRAAEPQCLLIVGRSGVGKTTLIQQYLAKHPPRDTAKGRILPVLFAQIPAPATIKGMASLLLEALGDPIPQKGTLDGMTQRLIKLIAACEVELIILDEFQHFIDREKNFKVLQTVSDWLKNFINTAKVPIILVGMPESVKVLTENDQLARRFLNKERLSPFEWKGDAKDEFMRFLDEIAKKLPLEEKPEIHTVDIAQRMFWATDGRAALVMKIIRSATREAILKGWPTFTVEGLANAYTKALVGEDDDLSNPFLGPLPPIDALGRPVRPSPEDEKKEPPKKHQKSTNAKSGSSFSDMVKGGAG